jgi:hypothetical protein
MSISIQTAEHKLLTLAHRCLRVGADWLNFNHPGIYLFPIEDHALAPRTVANWAVCLDVPFARSDAQLGRRSNGALSGAFGTFGLVCRIPGIDLALGNRVLNQ